MLTKREQHPGEKWAQSGIYKLTCPDCDMTYVGQTRRQFETRYNEHKTDFYMHHNSSGFTKHLTEHMHSFGLINKIMETILCHKKGAHLNMLERFHIFSEFVKNNSLNDPLTTVPNAIFKAITANIGS
jgi:hypothetical protein